MEELPVPGLVRLARRRAGLSQRDLARAVGLSQATIARIETGEHAPTVAVFARVLDVAALRLVVLDELGEPITPDPELEERRDRGGKHLPANVDLLAVEQSDRPHWWDERYRRGDAPAVTYHRAAPPRSRPEGPRRAGRGRAGRGRAGRGRRVGRDRVGRDRAGRDQAGRDRAGRS